MKQTIASRPMLFRMTKNADRKALQALFAKKSVQRIDTYDELLRELCATRHPELRGQPQALRLVSREFITRHSHGLPLTDVGVWVYFPWNQSVVHMLDESFHHELRTARNKNLITAVEQDQFRHCSVAVAGLSVGSHAAVSIALQGGGQHMRLADADTISGSNLNRLRTGVTSLGVNKAETVAREIYGMNPYASLKLFPHGLTEKNIRSFLTVPKKIGVLVEEMDNLVLKIRIRQEAKKLRIPVVMAADNGDGIILDVERYDLDPTTPILNGRIKGITSARVARATPSELAQMITEMIDPSVVTDRMKQSVGEVGKTLYSWPQLGGAAQLSGVVLAYAVRMIATGGPLRSGRTIISLEQLLT